MADVENLTFFHNRWPVTMACCHVAVTFGIVEHHAIFDLHRETYLHVSSTKEGEVRVISTEKRTGTGQDSVRESKGRSSDILQIYIYIIIYI